MMDCLFLPADCAAQLSADTPLYWQPVQGEGAPLSWAECASELAGHSLALVLPMAVVSACAVKLPTIKTRWLRQALPYAVEESLAEDVEHLHLSVGECLDDGRHLLLAVRRSLLQGWLAQLTAQGLQVAAIYVDADLLPRVATQVLVHGELGLLGGAGGVRLAFKRTDWDALTVDALKVAIDGAVTLLDEPCPWPLLAAGQTQAINLAQGEFSVRQGSGNWQAWRSVAALAGLWLVLQLGFDLSQSWYLQRQGDGYAAASQALYQQLFPADTRIVNLKAQFTEHLSAAAVGGQGAFFALLNHAVSALAEVPQLTVQEVDFSQERGDLAMQLHADDFAGLEQLRQRLQQADLQVQLGSASREAQGVSARMIIGGGL
jgi:general secretion pathway protein L